MSSDSANRHVLHLLTKRLMDICVSLVSVRMCRYPFNWLLLGCTVLGLRFVNKTNRPTRFDPTLNYPNLDYRTDTMNTLRWLIQYHLNSIIIKYTFSDSQNNGCSSQTQSSLYTHSPFVSDIIVYVSQFIETVKPRSLSLWVLGRNDPELFTVTHTDLDNWDRPK